ncbi:hypothetical protein V6N11_053538 [Hibiscus sabdariffa]|uniref:Reverse transcriptase/retrotransposon-derived protein RNase H-like domain-containing protein n=1 Tax=Hibiscus sabdariffa TaxID=183260 RepID=A0ABR2UDJ4_9ROSI
MLKRDPPQWSTAQSKAEKTLKEIFQHLPPLQIPSDGRRILQTDASDKYWGPFSLKKKTRKDISVDIKVEYSLMLKSTITLRSKKS